MLFDHLIRGNHGEVKAYASAREKARDFLLRCPLKTGYLGGRAHRQFGLRCHVQKQYACEQLHASSFGLPRTPS